MDHGVMLSLTPPVEKLYAAVPPLTVFSQLTNLAASFQDNPVAG